MIVQPIVSGGGSNLQLVNGNMVFGDGLRVSGTVYYNDENFQVASANEDGAAFKAVRGSLLTIATRGWVEVDNGLEFLRDTVYKVIGNFTVTFRS